MSGTRPLTAPRQTTAWADLKSVFTAGTWADQGHAGYVVDDPVTAAASCAGPCRMMIDQWIGPRTIVGLGEYCLLCEEQMEPGAVYLFARDPGGRHGVAHESCLEG